MQDPTGNAIDRPRARARRRAGIPSPGRWIRRRRALDPRGMVRIRLPATHDRHLPSAQQLALPPSCQLDTAAHHGDSGPANTSPRAADPTLRSTTTTFAARTIGRVPSSESDRTAERAHYTPHRRVETASPRAYGSWRSLDGAYCSAATAMCCSTTLIAAATSLLAIASRIGVCRSGVIIEGVPADS